jgi:cobalt/nickel transport system permease protein
VHIPDGFVSGGINLGAGATALALVNVALWRARRTLEDRVVPLLATTAAFLFAAQMINVPVAGGASGHLLGAVLAAVLLGPWNALLIMALVLTLQCLLFADGGLTALGTNICNLGLIGGVLGYGIFRALRAVLTDSRSGFLIAAGVAAWFSVVLAATACALELAISGTAPLSLVLPAMVSVHAVIGIGEALITTSILSLVLTARPDLLPGVAGGMTIPDLAR